MLFGLALLLSTLIAIIDHDCAAQNQSLKPTAPAQSPLPLASNNNDSPKKELAEKKLDESSLQILIERISPRFSTISSLNEAVVEMTIKNNGGSSFHLPTCGFTGKGGYYFGYHGKKPPFEISIGDSRQPTAGGSAVIKYQWKNKSNKTTVSGSSSLTSLSLTLAPNEYQQIAVPIAMPDEPGTYNLFVEFDNEDVWVTSQFYNSRILSERLGGSPRALYCRQSCSAEVNITKKKHTN